MTQEHPITPPPELVKQWATANGTVYKNLSVFCQNIANEAARWGADAELEACCEWLVVGQWFSPDGECLKDLRAARRPKPPSLKEQALKALENLNGDCLLEGFECPEKVATIRRALEALPD